MWLTLVMSLYYGSYYASVVDIINAETLRLDVAVWPGEQKEVSIRVEGISTPLLNGGCEAETLMAREAIELTRHFIGDQVILTDVRKSRKDQRVYATVRNKRGKLLSDTLIEVGYGVPATIEQSEKAGSWCPGKL